MLLLGAVDVDGVVVEGEVRSGVLVLDGRQLGRRQGVGGQRGEHHPLLVVRPAQDLYNYYQLEKLEAAKAA